MKKLIIALLTGLFLFSQTQLGFCVAIKLDYFEYSSDANAQAAYVTDSAEAVDQSATNAGVGDYWRLGDYGGVEYRLAQSFKLSGQVTVTAVEVKLWGSGGNPTGNWTLRIETDNAGYPSGTLANANASVVVVPPSAGNSVKGTFATPFILNASTTYWLKMDCDNQETNNRWHMEISTSSYGSGKAAYHDGSWHDVYRTPFWFKVYATNHLQCYSESTLKTQGSYSLKGVALKTNSLNDTLTRTVSPTIDLSNINTIKFDIYASRTGSNIKIGIRDSGGTTTEITPNITQANTWQTVTWDISGVSNANKDAIDRIIVTIVNADSSNTFYLDNFEEKLLITSGFFLFFN
jgi:hypothetical protein